MALSFFSPKPTARDFHCARLHRGEYLTGTNESARLIRHDFQVIHGEAEVRPGRAVRVRYGLEPETSVPTVLETFYLFPSSPYIVVRVEDARGSRTLRLFREEDRGRSRMFKQRILNPILSLAEAPVLAS